MKGRIEIDLRLCKGCLYCVEACPKGILEGNDGSAPSLIRPDDCTGCALCAQVCPDIAIAVWSMKE